ncbi:hypothetical protein GCK32_015141 [Trichostrongylus colubriformis]|uniref:Uncharacterized protein n=1 Tax=Trichostrongylus colubriformis TaxID=6319 RepID=A0AAN8J2J2_TRICO
MNEPDLSFIKSDIDLSEVAPLNRRRVVAFVNCYLYKMIDFLNAFANRAERAILEAERQLRAADIKLQLLEAKLASIPDSAAGESELLEERSQQLAAPTSTSSAINEQKITTMQNQDVAPSPVTTEAVPSEVDSREISASGSNVLLVKDDPAFAKYFRMLKLGVVEPAVKLKMQSEGVDPSVLDNPNAPSPNAIKASVPRKELTEDTSDSSSVSSFSDSN